MEDLDFLHKEDGEEQKAGSCCGPGLQSKGAALSVLLFNVYTTMWTISGKVVLKQATIHYNVVCIKL